MNKSHIHFQCKQKIHCSIDNTYQYIRIRDRIIKFTAILSFMHITVEYH